MRTLVLLSFLCCYANAEIVNLDAHKHIRSDGPGETDTPLVVELEAGNWLVTPTSDSFAAYSPWISNLRCDPRCIPKNPADRGFLHRWGASVDGIDLVPHQLTWDGFAYGEPEGALFNATTLAIVLDEPSSVEFYIPTGIPSNDNRGGISLELTALPTTVIDFEEFETEGENPSATHGASFSQTTLIIPGAPRTGFNGNSSGAGNGGNDSARTGNSIAAALIQGDEPQQGVGIVHFDFPVFDFSIDVLDVESNRFGNSEMFTARVYDKYEGGEPIEIVDLTGSDIGQKGDGNSARLNFESKDIRRLEFELHRSDGAVDPLLRGYGVDNISFASAHVAGDFNYDGRISIVDLDILAESLNPDVNDPIFDLNDDGLLGDPDRLFWVRNLKNTDYGDANLDGVFNSGDLVAMFASGEYEDRVLENSTWSEGDFSGDGDFSTSDLTLAFQTGTYVRDIDEVRSVPEPVGIWLPILLLLGLLHRGKLR